LIEQIAA